jgi:hypothetical protein
MKTNRRIIKVKRDPLEDEVTPQIANNIDSPNVQKS